MHIVSLNTETMKPRHILYLILFLLIPAVPLSAIPARNILHTFTQPDGTAFHARLQGDEHLHLVMDEQGHSLIRGNDGWWYYAFYQADGKKVSSGYPAGQEAPAHILSASRFVPSQALRLRTADRLSRVAGYRARRLEQMRHRLQGRPVTKAGETEPANHHSIVILAEFTDTKMTFTRDNFLNMLTQKGYNYNGAHGSAMDYFDEMFQGDYHFEFTVSPVVTLDHDSAYYFDNNDKDEDKDPAQAIIDACTKAHEQGIDFSRFDDDGDGEVDNIIVFVAGKDEAEGADASCVWSHAWAVRDGAGKTCYLDGKLINGYAITTEYGMDGWRNNEYHYGFTGIGTFCHEFSHTFGLPDFYDTDYEGSGGQGDGLFGILDLMDGGNGNDYGRRPPHYSALDYYLLGLGQCETIGTGNYTLEPISSARRYLKFETGTEGEFYLFECRSNASGWDKDIRGKGLLIYHVDQAKRSAGRSDTYEKDMTAFERWDYNEVNANPEHECAYVVSATPGIHAKDSEGYDSGNQGKVFYPQPSYKEYSSDTNPAFVFWDKTESPIALVNIALRGTSVSFTVQEHGSSTVPEIAKTSKEVFQDAAILQWSANNPAYTGTAIVEWGASATQTRQTVEVAPYEPGNYALRLDGLNGSTAYKADIRFERGGSTSKIVTVSFTTNAFRGGVPYIVLPANEGSFTSRTEIPLHVNNAQNTDGVDWYLGSSSILPSGNGYYPLTKSGTLKAVVTYKDGTKDIIIREIKIR